MKTSTTIKIGEEAMTSLYYANMNDNKFAIRELVFNSYDSDADWVDIVFQDFANNYKVQENSKIIIKDNGAGIGRTMLEKWLVPATTSKARKDEANIQTEKNRPVRGINGNGRFSIFALGRKVKITTKTKEDTNEYTLEYDLSKYEHDYIMQAKEQQIFSEHALLTTQQVDNNHSGSTIEISCLKDNWNELEFIRLYEKMLRRLPLLSARGSADFEIRMYQNDKCRKTIKYSHKSQLLTWKLLIIGHIITNLTKMRIIARNIFAG